jgi:hypothetical protein
MSGLVVDECHPVFCVATDERSWPSAGAYTGMAPVTNGSA